MWMFLFVSISVVTLVAGSILRCLQLGGVGVATAVDVSQQQSLW